MALILTRIQVGDFGAWKPMFDADVPGTRRDALGHHVFRGIDDPDEVYIQIEFASVEDAQAARERLVASGVLDRFDDMTGPTVVEKVETVLRPPDT